jgi:hypothetical protein
MTTTTRDAQALTYLATRLREETHGCGKWDQNGTYSVISELVGLSLTDTLNRIIGHALDPEARTPGAIKRPFVPKVSTDPSRPTPPKVDEACRACGRRMHSADEVCSSPTTRPVERTTDVSAPIAHLRALRDETTAELCTHGVKRTNCHDHRNAETEPTETDPEET